MNTKHTSFTLIAVLAASVSMAQAPAKEKAAPAKTATATAAAAAADDPIVIAFGTNQIRKSELEAAIRALPDEYQQYVQTIGKRAFAEDYLRMKVLSAEAVKNGLEKDPVVAMQLKLVRDNALATAEISRIEKSITISDADIAKAYEAKKAEFEVASARHILVAFKGSPAARPDKPELTEEQAKSKAEEIRAKVSGGADFAELAKTESDDTSSGTRGGDLGSFPRGRMVPEFEKAVFEGKVGEVGPVVRTQFGFHVIQVTERKTQSVDEVRSQLEGELKETKMQESLDNLKASVKATFNDTYFEPVAPAEGQAPAPKPATSN